MIVFCSKENDLTEMARSLYFRFGVGLDRVCDCITLGVLCCSNFIVLAMTLPPPKPAFPLIGYVMPRK